MAAPEVPEVPAMGGVDEEEEEEEAEPAADQGKLWPPKGLLANRWEQRPLIREQLRSEKKLLLWPAKVTIGVASQASLKLNRYVVADILTEWGKISEEPVAPPIGWLRQEAGLS